MEHGTKKKCLTSQEAIDCNKEGGVYRCTTTGQGICEKKKPIKDKKSRKEIIRGK